MAIVKMSEFNLLLMNDHVDEVLQELQLYKNVSFKDLRQTGDKEFKAVHNTYDFERNRFIQERLKDVLNSVSEFEKKHRKKGKPLEKLNVISLSFEELNERCQHIEIEQLLNTYDKYYDVAKEVIEGYTFYRPWDHQKMKGRILEELHQTKPIIGTIAQKDVKACANELKKIGEVFFMYRDQNEDQAIFVLLPLKEHRAEVEIVLDKYHFQFRSASSLGIKVDIEKVLEHLDQLIEKRTNIDKRLGTIGNYREELQLYYEYLQNEELRYRTKLSFLNSSDVTQIAGWIFTEDIEKFNQLLNSKTEGIYYLEIEEVPLDSTDVPIKLKNNKFVSAFEGITNMYSLPRYYEIDPTALFTPFYAIFFGMMLGDIGYGLIMGIVTFLLIQKNNLKATTENFLRFLMYLSVPTIFWGWVYGSFFGGLIPVKGLIDINQDFMLILIFAICFGIFHLFVGLGIKAYLYFRMGHPWLALFDVGFWYLTLAGAIILISQMFTDILSPYSQIGWIIMIVGMVGIILTNGREAKTLFGKFASGLYSLYGLSNYIGDVLSYSRLMALGLAGASIGVAFNMIVAMLSGFGFFGIIAGFIVFMIGHSFNLGISGLSAYVHSARLTYVEYFSKFYTGGGKRFEEFRSKNTYININQEDN